VESAVLAGADAVYFGGQVIPHMRAQRQSSNLSADEVEAAVRICHTAGAGAFYTLNSPYFDAQFGDIERDLEVLESIGVDAVIASDLGLIERIAARHPELPVHVSIQVGTTNTRAAAFLARLGAHRVTLERSVQIEEAAHIRARTGLKVDLFAFGPQCASYDAWCQLGQYFTGAVCKNSCMHTYAIDGAISGKKRWLFMKYYSGLARVPELVAQGIDGLKLEGRSRSHRYVELVTSVFREAVDSCTAGEFEVKDSWLRDLGAAALHAEITEGFIGGDFDRGEVVTNFSMRSRAAYLRELSTILLGGGTLEQVLGELRLAAAIDITTAAADRVREVWRQARKRSGEA